MTIRTLLSGLACLGFVACAGAQIEETTVPVFTMADVEAAPDAWRAVDPENLVIMQTSRGEIVIELSPEMAPRHVAHFKKYVRAGLYDDTVFHRVIKGFMAQGGDVQATHGADKMLDPLEEEFTVRVKPSELEIAAIGQAASSTGGYLNGMPIENQAQFLAEMSVDGLVESWIPHCPGVLSSARTADRDSANAQFFLISEDGRHLDRKYTAKGRAIAGLDVIKAIKLGPSPDGYPISNPDVVTSVVIAADQDEAIRRKAYVQRTNTPEWQAIFAAADKARQDPCDLPPVPAVVQ
jgi:peptidylprolyl isomerase